MSKFAAFKRQPVPAQAAQRMQAITLAAPTRGLVMNENEAFMQPGGCVVLDNWSPTMRGLKLRAGCIKWCTLPNPTPVVSAFEYASGNNHEMFAAQDTALYNVSSSAPGLVTDIQTNGNYSASQLANAAGDYLIAVNDGGDYPMRYDGIAWTRLDTDQIHGPPDTTVEHGKNLIHVCKYRNRWFFIEGGSMNAWYLPLNAIQGALLMIPLSGAATKGGKLMFAATWSVDAGDGIDDKLVFVTTLGELLIFTGSDPGNAAAWRQEGRYQIGAPMGKNAHTTIGGDLLIATTDGITPVSAAITKTAEQLDLAAITLPIKNMWRDEVADKNDLPWTLRVWEEYGAMFVTWPGGRPGRQYCAMVNTATSAWARFTGWDALCWIKMRKDMFFGTQLGVIMQADRGGTDDGKPYTASMVGSWSRMTGGPETITWRQARASFASNFAGSFQPQLAACTDYIVRLPTPPPPAEAQPLADVWDQGLWDDALWDADAPASRPDIRNTGWVSIGETGYAHAPVVQVSVAQAVRPNVELISYSVVYERCGVNV